MDSVMKEFLASGRTLITDTMEVKSKIVNQKKPSLETVTVTGDWAKVLISRCVDEKISKLDVVKAFTKIIEREEEKI